MEGIKLLSDFFETIEHDFKIAPVHISLYMALLSLWQRNGCRNPVIINRPQVMNLAKISARLTYYRTMKDLHNYRLIKYWPSSNQFCAGLVFLIDPDEKINVLERRLHYECAANYSGRPGTIQTTTD